MAEKRHEGGVSYRTPGIDYFEDREFRRHAGVFYCGRSASRRSSRAISRVGTSASPLADGVACSSAPSSSPSCISA